MKLDQIPTRRKPVKKTVYARLFNKTKPRKQRASAAAASPDEMDGAGINISRSLSIIFAIHILAIGMIFIHKQYLSGRTTAPVASKPEVSNQVVASSPERNDALPVLSSGDKPYMVKKGDNYAIIAEKFEVDESELREMNRGADIRAGVVLRIPQTKRIIAQEPAEVVAIRSQQQPNAAENGLVEILPPVEGSQNRDAAKEIPKATPVSVSGQTHKVESGENIWRISKKYNVSQKELMTLNGITDPTKLRIGQVLKLP